MFWDDVEPKITPRLAQSVERSYEVFAGYGLGAPIIHCDCPVCMSKEIADALSVLPLREISASLLAEYTNSAHGYDRETIEPEFKHFLPRYLDLIAHCRPPTHLDLVTCLSRLHGYRTFWPKPEVDAVNGFFDAFVEASLFQTRLLKWPVGHRLEFDMGEVLAMIVTAGGDFQSALAVIDAGPDPEVGLHMASMRLELDLTDLAPGCGGGTREEFASASQLIGAWLQREAVSQRILTASGLLKNPDYDDILNLAF